MAHIPNMVGEPASARSGNARAARGDASHRAKIMGEGSEGTPGAGLLILVPVYDDWDAVALLLPRLDDSLAEAGLRARVLLVDDGSTRPVPEKLFAGNAGALVRVDVLALRLNMGHQRAIAVGLAYIEANVPSGTVIVMDGDGEDRAEDVPRLVRRHEELGGRIVFAERRRRSNSLAFCLFYGLYRWTHRLLTGLSVRVGNFSVIPRSVVHQLVVSSSLWNHYAAAVYKARLPFELVPTRRGRRLAGEAKMDFVSLVGHGLSAISVFSDRVGVRLLLGISLLAVVSLIGLGSTSAVYAFSGTPLPVQLMYAAALLVIVLFQMLLFSLVFVFFVLAGRSDAGFIPVRDHACFIDRVLVLFVEMGH